MTSLHGRTALVTGAARGIGAAIAARLAADGATVVVTDVDGPGAEASAGGLGEGHLGLCVDVTDRGSVDAAVAQVLDRCGGVDVLVNNAGWDTAESFLDSDRATWDRVIGINLYGVLNTCHSILPHMIERGRGSVVNLGSDAGRVGSSGEVVYSAAKGGVIAFTKAVAREVARHDVNVNCVSPGPTDTQLFASMGGEKLREALVKAIPFRRLGRPEDVANAVAFLASDDAAFVTGQTISVSGGLTMS